MEENVVMNNEVTEVNDEMMEIVPEQVTTESSTGLTKGQKATGIFVIAAALYGVGSLIYKGVKWVITKVKAHKAKKAAKEVEIVPDDEVIDVDMTAEEIQAASTEK